MESNKISAVKEENIDIKKYVFKVLSYWYLFIICLFIALSIAYFVNRYTMPVFNVAATVLITDKENRLLGGVESLIEELGLYKKSKYKRNVENEIGILHSFTLTRKTLEKLNFQTTIYSIGRINSPERYQTAPFVVNLDSSHNQLKDYPIKVYLLSKEKYRLEIDDRYNVNTTLNYGEQFVNDVLDFNITLKNKDSLDLNHPSMPRYYYFTINDLDRLARSRLSKLTIEAYSKKSSIIKIASSGHIPQKEVDFLNTLINVYIQSNLDEKNQMATNTIEFIDKQLDDIVDSLEKAEIDLQNFRLSSNSIVDISQEGMALFSIIEELQTKKSMLNIKVNYFNYLLEYLHEKDDLQDLIAPSVVGINDQLLNKMVLEVSELYKEKNMLMFSVKKNITSIDELNERIKIARETLIENVNNLIKAAEIELNDVTKRINRVNADIRKLPVTERELIGYKRVFSLNDNLYTFLLEKKAEASIAKASNVPDNKVIDYARADYITMTSPKRSLNYIIAFIIGFLIPLVFIILKDYFNNTIEDRKDIEEETDVPILGSIGHNNKGVELVVHEKPKSSISESFRSLRTNLQYLLTNKKNRIIAISSTISGEGKTFCAENLAAIIAMSNKKTLLIGLDLRKPKIHRDFNLNNDKGVSTYLINKCSYEDIVHPSEIDNLYIANSGPVPPNPAELLETQRLDDFIQKATEEFDYVIVDTPPVAIVTDALLISRFVDLNIFVIRQNYSSKSVVKLIDEMYNKRGMKNISILINDIKVPSYYGYKYGYKYGYGYAYGYGYGYGYGYYEDDEKRPPLWKKIFLFKKDKK